jgi:hypothetical protein
MYGEAVLTSLDLFIPLSPLVHNDIDNFVLVTNVLRGYGHETVDDFTEKFDVAAGVASYAGREFAYCLFVLFGSSQISRVGVFIHDQPWRCPLGR